MVVCPRLRFHGRGPSALSRTNGTVYSLERNGPAVGALSGDFRRMRSMREPSSIPTLVPGYDAAVYIVIESFGKLGRAYRETDEANTDLDTVVRFLLSGEYRRPVRVIAFNTAEGWARDVSEDVAWEVLRCVKHHGTLMPGPTREFVNFHVGETETALAENGII